ncbi:MAG: glycoside hydrolase family 6 protein [Chloroflexia bacterium]
MLSRKVSRHVLGVCTLIMALVSLPTVGGASPTTLDPNTQFHAPQPPDHGATLQIARLTASGQHADADLIRSMVDTPQAIWFTSGDARSVEQDVRQAVALATAHRTVPVLVAYYVPGRDCSQYSAGGAPTGDAYRAWIDGFVVGLRDRQAIVILEPDGLALLPTDCGQQDTYNRVALINYAAHALLRDPNALVYLDAGHSAWHAVGDMAARLVQAGVLDVQGFFSNVSNFRWTQYETHFDTWISQCIAFGTDAEEGGWRLGHFDWCASQYYSPLGPVDPNDISTWHYSDQWYAANLGHAVPTVHFVVDTSRNGQGPWVPPPHPAGDPQDWCNPPDRGLGLRPTANTGVPLADAYLWIKTPGQSDGQCTRWGPGPADPVRGIVDPPAGQWFPDMALELVHNANPPIR